MKRRTFPITRTWAVLQLWEWQLEELALYYLLYSEAANVRHLSEALWFLFWVLRNSPAKMGQVGIRPVDTAIWGLVQVALQPCAAASCAFRKRCISQGAAAMLQMEGLHVSSYPACRVSSIL